ncbi:MAG: DeoR/GlpR transcriptional regulator [Oscillospiraceae bacterium]|nr:DeoR/GlpR transcriptional regulator [Oscillospiraceae bacterium]
MYHIERLEQIMQILEKNHSISVSDLSQQLFVSQPTIRRDLTLLEEQGKVLRTHGGVVLRKLSDAEIPLMIREDQNNASKRTIAEKASRLISDGNVIFLDASSTVSYLIPYLEKFNDLIVITNSPKTSLRLGERNIKNYCTGGLLLMHSLAYVGSEAERFVSNINADLFFFSSRGYTEGGSISDSSEREVTMKKAMLHNSKRIYYLCDSSKKNKTFAFNICSVSEIDRIIDDEIEK